MIKLLFDTDCFIKAGRQDQTTVRLLENGRQNRDVQMWILAGSIEQLVEAGLSGKTLESLLDGVAQIPVNALLNQKALDSGKPYKPALLEAAADLFKIPVIVSDRFGSEEFGKRFQASEHALTLLTADEQPEKVDFMNLNLALHPIFNKVDGWFSEIIQNTAFAGGSHVDAFEKEFAAYCGTEYAIGVSNGTDALRFALLAMNIGPGDEVITVPNTFIATTEVISQIGAEPVFVDVTEDTYTLDPELIKQKITGKTKAIIPVHLYGHVANMDQILQIADEHGLQVLEDACQAHGAVYNGRRAGSLGKAGAFSMYPGKNLGAFGEAGCVVTNDQKIDDTVRCLREHGQSKKYYHRMEGYNGRMDNLQAAALRGKLEFLDDWNQRRRELASLYLSQLKDVQPVVLPQVPNMSAHVFHLFVILVPEPQNLHEYLKSKRIFTAFHYPVPLHLQQAYKDRVQGQSVYPVSERCAEKLISLPMFPELTESQVLKVCAEIRQFYAT